MQATWNPSTAQGDSQIVLPVLVLMRKPLPVVVKLRESFRLSSCGISFKPAQHELFVIEPIKEVCEEKGEEGDNFCGRGNDKHAAEKQKNLQSMSHCALGYFLIGGKQGSFENLDWRNEKVSERSSSPVCHLCLDVP